MPKAFEPNKQSAQNKKHDVKHEELCPSNDVSREILKETVLKKRGLIMRKTQVFNIQRNK